MAEFRVVFVASDYDATLTFFTETMGLDVLREFDNGGTRGCIVLAAGGQLEFFDSNADWGASGVDGVRLAWEISDADAEYRRLIEAGATLLSAPTVQPWGHKNFAVDGPDGWVITLFEVTNIA